MGRRTRRRAAAPPIASPARRRPERPERPRAPWHPFPLVELCVLIGLVLLVWGLLRAENESGRILMVCGMALASLAGLDTALREHFSGFKSHAGLLAAVPAVLTAAVLAFARAPWLAAALAAGLVLAAAFLLLRRRFRRG